MKNVSKMHKSACLLHNISSRPFKIQSSLAVHTAYFLSWKASESKNVGQKGEGIAQSFDYAYL